MYLVILASTAVKCRIHHIKLGRNEFQIVITHTTRASRGSVFRESGNLN